MPLIHRAVYLSTQEGRLDPLMFTALADNTKTCKFLSFGG
jgi:hypothetical protein